MESIRDHVHSLTEIVQIVEGSFQELFRNFQFRMKGEVQSCKLVRGRYYLELVEYDTQGNVLASAKGIVREQSIMQAFLEKTNFSSSDELISKEILIQGSCNLHHKRGFSISIHTISAEYLLGVQQQHIDQIRKRLRAADLYDRNRQLSLGYPPFRVAVISSPTSEGLRDFESVIAQSAYHIESDLYPSAVEGNQAKEQVAQALHTIHQQIEAGSHYHAVLLIRGGGGKEGFARQNDEQIATSIGQMPAPVIVAIGHTADSSLLDEICYAAAKTPTDAAYLLLEHLSHLDEQVRIVHGHIHTLTKGYVEHAHLRLDHLKSQIDQRTHLRLDQLAERIMLRWKAIHAAGPEHVYTKGYATIHDTDGNVLTNEQIAQTKPGDLLKIRTKGRELEVNVIK